MGIEISILYRNVDTCDALGIELSIEISTTPRNFDSCAALGIDISIDISRGAAVAAAHGGWAATAGGTGVGRIQMNQHYIIIWTLIMSLCHMLWQMVAKIYSHCVFDGYLV